MAFAKICSAVLLVVLASVVLVNLLAVLPSRGAARLTINQIPRAE